MISLFRKQMIFLMKCLSGIKDMKLYFINYLKGMLSNN